MANSLTNGFSGATFYTYLKIGMIAVTVVAGAVAVQAQVNNNKDGIVENKNSIKEQLKVQFRTLEGLSTMRGDARVRDRTLKHQSEDIKEIKGDVKDILRELRRNNGR